MVHELMKKGVDESPDVTRDLKMPVVPEVDVFVATSPHLSTPNGNVV